MHLNRLRRVLPVISILREAPQIGHNRVSNARFLDILTNSGDRTFLRIWGLGGVAILRIGFGRNSL